MIATLQNLVRDIGPEWIAATAAVYAATISLFTMYMALLGLRAKRRAGYAIRQALLIDPHLKELLKASNHKDLTEAEVEQLRCLILVHIKKLSERDRRFVDAGLHQHSVRGLHRFMQEVVGHKMAA